MVTKEVFTIQRNAIGGAPIGVIGYFYDHLAPLYKNKISPENTGTSARGQSGRY